MRRETVAEIFPSVVRISIRLQRFYFSIAAEKELGDDEELCATYLPNVACDFTYPCKNGDCTCGVFDLYSIVSFVIAHKETYAEGIIKCDGKESRKYPNASCPCELNYKITIEYK